MELSCEGREDKMKNKIFYAWYIGLLLSGVMRLASLLDKRINKNSLSHLTRN
jgi:hypothetical protein